MPRLVSDLLFESQAVLRLVDAAIGELNAGPAAHREPDVRGAVVHDAELETTHALHDTHAVHGVQHACIEIGAILDHLRASRDALDHALVQDVAVQDVVVHDIGVQHVEHASLAMREAEERLRRIVALLDPAVRGDDNFGRIAPAP